MTEKTAIPNSVDATETLLAAGAYVADRSLATALYLALKLGRPLFLEGEAGVGKTEIAKVLSECLGRDLIRLQCYEGLDVSSAVYEWNYARQMIEIRLAEATGEAGGQTGRATLTRDVFAEEFLIKRPLLQALEPRDSGPPVLLIDELDRTDEPFEAFLLEVLSDFQITVPEIGVFEADDPPIVIVTSNRTREIHDALKRRCFYYWVDYPDAERELEILGKKAPEAGEALRRDVVAFIQRLRDVDLFKLPGVAESIDWAQALAQLDVVALDPDTLNATLGTLLKYQDDIERIRAAKRCAFWMKSGPRRPSTGCAGPEANPGRTSACRSIPHPIRKGPTAARAAFPAAAADCRKTSCISPACCAQPACRSGRARSSVRSKPRTRSVSARARIFTGRCTRFS